MRSHPPSLQSRPFGGLRTALALFPPHILAYTNTKGRHIARHDYKHTSLGLTVSVLSCLGYTFLNINLTATLPIQQWKWKRGTNLGAIHKIGWKIKWVSEKEKGWGVHELPAHYQGEPTVWPLYPSFYKWLSIKNAKNKTIERYCFESNVTKHWCTKLDFCGNYDWKIQSLQDI